MDKSVIIIPGCNDLNRGDQALGWETARIAKDAGFDGECFLMSEKNEPTKQSIKEGFKIIRPILEHPSRYSKERNNIKYSFIHKLKWGFIALFDFLKSFLIQLII